MKTVKNMSIKELNELKVTGKVRTDLAYQRAEKSAWKRAEHLSKFLDSIVNEYSCGVLHFCKTESGIYEAIDGKQRLTVIEGILNGTIPVNNLMFTDWEQSEKESFLKYIFPVVVLSGMDDMQKREQFVRLNAGINLSKTEKSRGEFLPFIELAKFQEVSRALLPILPQVAGNDPTRESADTIILQALSYNLPKFNGFGGAELAECYKGIDPSNLQDDLNVLCDWVTKFAEAVKADETKKEVKSVVSKPSALSALLAAVVTDATIWDDMHWSRLAGFSFNRSIHASRGADQQNLFDNSQSGCAAKVNVDARVSVFARVLSGKASKNVAKPDKVITPKVTKESNDVKTLFETFRADWGVDFANQAEFSAVISMLEREHCTDIMPFTSNGKHQISLLDGAQKARFYDWSEVLKKSTLVTA